LEISLLDVNYLTAELNPFTICPKNDPIFCGEKIINSELIK
jgi:hypothetical protein